MFCSNNIFIVEPAYRDIIRKHLNNAIIGFRPPFHLANGNLVTIRVKFNYIIDCRDFPAITIIHHYMVYFLIFP